MDSRRLRWLLDPPADGATNMARDEALLQSVGGGAPPMLRFYRWSEPTISLGYFQPYAEYEALPAPAGDLAVVRRQTGGGAILHDLELTYSLTLPMGHRLLARGANHLYVHVHDVFAARLRRLAVPVDPGPASPGPASHRGPFFCFERHSCYDLLAGGRKIMGSAQRRTAGAVLQHGSLILATRYPQQACAAVGEFVAWDIDADLPQIAEEIAGGPVLRCSALFGVELDSAAELRGKYASAEWTRAR